MVDWGTNCLEARRVGGQEEAGSDLSIDGVVLGGARGEGLVKAVTGRAVTQEAEQRRPSIEGDRGLQRCPSGSRASRR
jgi:hypothetical protein